MEHKTEKKRKLKASKGETTKAKKAKRSHSEDNDSDVLEHKSDVRKAAPLWDDYEVLADQHGIDAAVAKNIVTLFENDNTIPFIARYRKNQTGNMDAETLREIKDAYESICGLKAKQQKVLSCVSKAGALDETLTQKILSSRTSEELEYIYAPYKPGSKKSLAEKAKELGLDEPAQKIISGSPININSYINTSEPQLKSIELVEKGIVHIIASVISTNTDVLQFLRKLKNEINCVLESKKTVRKKTVASSTQRTDKKGAKSGDESKYEHYFDFKIPIKYAKSHQVLAINRAEAQKILSVKVVVPDVAFRRFSDFCKHKWKLNSEKNVTKTRLFTDAINDSYTRLLQPLLTRQIRSELKLKAEKASYEVFATNLKQLLLARPLKNKRILGIDPGFSNGCKLALISETGSVLAHSKIYPHSNASASEREVANVLQKNDCALIALGNGTACRETEEWLSSAIKRNAFAPLDVSYVIVSEDGASIYSCSPEAKKEFPDLDPNVISAASLARRVQDPLAELVKIEPQHIGVGMYQHDMRKKQLENVLNEVVSECVSFVGVDLNTASQCLLRKIAGLSDKRATEIIRRRETNGPFVNRKQLLEVKGIGPKVFEQCAGFLRITPSKNLPTETNVLDCTYIHPESYETAIALTKSLKLSLNRLGTPEFIKKIESVIPTLNMEKLSEEFDTSVESLQLILESLSKPLNYDLRSVKSQSALFKKGLMDMNDLKVGTVLTGRVGNVTQFGCFVDVGVGRDGLIHVSNTNGLSLKVGDRVEVTVESIELQRKRIGLFANKKL